MIYAFAYLTSDLLYTCSDENIPIYSLEEQSKPRFFKLGWMCTVWKGKGVIHDVMYLYENFHSTVFTSNALLSKKKDNYIKLKPIHNLKVASSSLHSMFFLNVGCVETKSYTSFKTKSFGNVFLRIPKLF